MPRGGGVPVVRAAGVLLGMAVLLSGCGGDGDDRAGGATSPPSASAPPVTRAPTTSPAPAETGWDEAFYTYRGLRIPLRPGWRVAEIDPRGGEYSVGIRTGDCVRTEMGDEKCPGFLLVGPEGIERAYEDDGVTLNPYTPSRAYHPATDVQPCYDRAAAAALEAGPGSLQKSSTVKVDGSDAAYREWRIPCREEETGRVGERFFVQREWYLAAERILVVDHWRTAGLDDALTRSTWR